MKMYKRRIGSALVRINEAMAILSKAMDDCRKDGNVLEFQRLLECQAWLHTAFRVYNPSSK